MLERFGDGPIAGTVPTAAAAVRENDEADCVGRHAEITAERCAADLEPDSMSSADICSNSHSPIATATGAPAHCLARTLRISLHARHSRRRLEGRARQLFTPARRVVRLG